MGRVEGKVAYVTGGASGLGAECARVMAREGAKIILADVDKAGAEKVAAEIGGDVLVLDHDVTQENAWRDNLDRAAAHFGKLNILVHAAGISRPSNVVDATFDHWKQVQAINEDSTFFCMKYGIQVLEKCGEPGSIVNFSSSVALRPVSMLCAYSASKAAALSLTKTAALYCAEKRNNIRVNAILPGAIRTPMMEWYLQAAPNYEEALAQFSANHPVGHAGQPIDIAMAVLYLASDESKYTTGIALPVDGGYLAA